MFIQGDQQYYEMRATQERRMAKDAQDARVAALHLDLAARYEALAQMLSKLHGATPLGTLGLAQSRRVSIRWPLSKRPDTSERAIGNGHKTASEQIHECLRDLKAGFDALIELLDEAISSRICEKRLAFRKHCAAAGRRQKRAQTWRGTILLARAWLKPSGRLGSAWTNRTASAPQWVDSSHSTLHVFGANLAA